MSLAIFDLDNTLLAGDSDYLWGQHLIDLGVVDKEYYESENQRFYAQYKAGELDIFEFLRFSLKPLSAHPLDTLHRWRDEFVSQKIRPIMLPAAQALIDEHKALGHTCMIITATNRFVTQPIAEAFGIDILLATEPEFDGEQYTGDVSGIPTFQSGKVTRLEEWLEGHPHSMDSSWFYSDSHNDIPLLERVTYPIVVDGDDKLVRYGEQKGWKIISLRE